MDVKNETIFLQCECLEHSDHTIRVTVDDDWGGDTYPPQFIVSAQMSHYRGFWGRLGIALKYVLGIDNTYCHYTDTICSLEQMDRLIGMVERQRELYHLRETESVSKSKDVE